VSVDSQDSGIEALVQEIRQFAGMYCAMALGKERDEELRDAFDSLAEFKVEVAYPFLLEVYGDQKAGLISKSTLAEIVRLVENYAFRRYVVQIPTNSMNKTFARFSLSIDKTNYLASVKAQFALLTSYRRFPSDDEFRSSLRLRDLYHTRNNFWWLARIENYGHKEILNLEKFSIEHILPQNKELNDWWKKALGDDFSNVQEKYLHTIGNLTLTRYNSEFSDRSFPEKCDHPEGGFSKTNLRLNEGLGQLNTWNESEIVARANVLINKVLEVWPTLTADPELVKEIASEKKVAPKADYTYADHKYLAYPEMMNLFEELKGQVLGIDPAAYEDILKYYIAFKADTNFVDVITQAKKLRLTINLRFRDVRDPDGKCKDISGSGRWGNGEVSMDISNKEEITYAMFIIKQAFDAQLETASG
jgi:predicted transport protein